MSDVTSSTTYAKWFVLGVMLIVPLTYEGWALLNGRPSDTISSAVWALCHRPWFQYSLPVVWFAVGVHFFITPETWKQALVGAVVGALTFLKKPGTHL